MADTIHKVGEGMYVLMCVLFFYLHVWGLYQFGQARGWWCLFPVPSASTLLLLEGLSGASRDKSSAMEEVVPRGAFSNPQRSVRRCDAPGVNDATQAGRT